MYSFGKLTPWSYKCKRLPWRKCFRLPPKSHSRLLNCWITASRKSSDAATGFQKYSSNGTPPLILHNRSHIPLVSFHLAGWTREDGWHSCTKRGLTAIFFVPCVIHHLDTQHTANQSTFWCKNQMQSCEPWLVNQNCLAILTMIQILYINAVNCKTKYVTDGWQFGLIYATIVCLWHPLRELFAKIRSVTDSRWIHCSCFWTEIGHQLTFPQDVAQRRWEQVRGKEN